MATLTPSVLQALRRLAEAQGLLRLSAVRLDHPGFSAARERLHRFIDEGRAGDMEFIVRTRAVRGDPALMLPGARALLIAMVPYEGESGPIARYAQPADYHTVVHARLDAVAAALREQIAGARTLVCVDTKPVMERAAAVLAGLGFLGKNGMLIAPGLGSYVLLGEILTTAAIDGDDAAVDLARVRWDACGACTRCLDACPTAAFTGPGELDPRRCISYRTIEHRSTHDDALDDAAGERIAGCDVCQEVCPYNAGRSRTAKVPSQAWLPARAQASRTLDLAVIAGLRNNPHRAFVRDSALRRIPRRSLRRNALIALGNRSGPLSDGEREAVQTLAEDPDPDLRAAAIRALRRRG